MGGFSAPSTATAGYWGPPDGIARGLADHATVDWSVRPPPRRANALALSFVALGRWLALVLAPGPPGGLDL